jgi:hypothetical protein
MLSPEQVDSGVFDIADQQFLKYLIDTIGLDVIGRLRTFCSGRSSIPTEGREDNRSEVEIRVTFFGHGNQRVKSLSRKVEQVLEELQQISSEHRFGEVNTEYKEERDDEPPLSKRRRIDHTNNDDLHFDASTIEESDRPSNPAISGKAQRAKSNPSTSTRPHIRVAVGEQAVGDSEDEDSFHEYNDSSSDEDAFGVRGDWGNEHDSAGDDTSSYSLIHEEITVTN